MEFLEWCLQSLERQLSAPSCEILIHDDCSTDGSVALIKSRFPRVRLLTSSRNIGYCRSNNRLADIARGEYLLLLNNDAALFEDALKCLRRAAESEPTSILTLPQFDVESSALVDRGCLIDIFSTPSPNFDPTRQQVAYGIGACLWIPRSVWDEFGGFPEWMDSIGEDLYVCTLARLRGHGIQVLNASGYLHHQGASFGGNKIVNGQLKTTFRRRYLSERNRLYYTAICTPTVLMYPITGMLVIVLFAEGVLLTLIKRDLRFFLRIYGVAIVHFARSWQLVMRQRAAVQARRKISLSKYFSVFRFIPRKLEMLVKFGIPKLADK